MSYLEIALATGALAVLLAIAWRLVPRGSMTIAINVLSAAGIFLAEALAYLAVFDWREVLPAEFAHWAPWIVLSINIASIAAKAGWGRPQEAQP